MFPVLTPNTAILGICKDSASSIHLINHILLLFKLYIYKSQNKYVLNINELLTSILNIKNYKRLLLLVIQKNQPLKISPCFKKYYSET